MHQAWHAWDPGPLTRTNTLFAEGDWFAAPPSVLPLLQQKKHYSTLAYRYARGSEAVMYVDRIRTYYKILQPVLDELALDTTRTVTPRVYPGL